MLHKLRMMFQQARDERGFTLVELLMVMVIIGVLAGLGFTGFSALQNRSAKAQADTYWRDLNTAAGMYRVEQGGYPTKLEDLTLYLDTGQKPWGGTEAANNVTKLDDEDGDYDGFEARTGKGVEFGFGDGFVCVWVNGIDSGQNHDDCP